MNRKFGFTLIELLVSMSVGSLLTSIAIGVVIQSMTMTTSTTEWIDEERAANRLVEQFRSDARHASTFIVESPQNVMMQLSSGTITYRVEENQVIREQTLPDAVTARDRFFVGRHRTAAFTETTNPVGMSLVVTRDPELKNYGRQTDRMVIVTLSHLSNAPINAVVTLQEPKR